MIHRIAIAALWVALVGLQAWILEAEPEFQEEAKLAKFERVPEAHLLSSYLSVQLLGSFRSLAIIGLWMELSDLIDPKRTQDRKVYRMKELLDLLKLLQPRNQIIRWYLCQEMMFDIASSVNVRDRWKWEKRGALEFAQAIRDFPDSPFLIGGLAMSLILRANPGAAQFNDEFIQNLLRDGEVQKELNPAGGEASTPFQIAIAWWTRCREILQRPQYSPVGGRMDPVDFSSHIRHALFLQAMWHLKGNRLDECRHWLDKARQQSLFQIQELQDSPRMSPMFPRLPAFFGLAKERVIPFDSAPERIVQAYEHLMREYPSYDDGFFVRALAEAKRKISGDLLEWNDIPATQFALLVGAPVEAAIGPEGDLDHFVYNLGGDRRNPFSPFLGRFTVKNEGTGTLRLTIRLARDDRSTSTWDLSVGPRSEKYLDINFDLPGALQFVVSGEGAATIPYRLQLRPVSR